MTRKVSPGASPGDAPDGLATDPAYLRYQYDDATRLRVRQESHRLYSEVPNSAFLEWVVDWLGAGPGERVLDAGCGPGTYHALLHARGAAVVALDLSAGMLREVRAQAGAGGLAVAPLRADAQAVPLGGGSCDRALAAHMLYHVPDRARALAELRRVVRPAGRVVLVTGAGDDSPLREIHRRVARDLGYTPTEGPGARFTLEDLPLVREAFPTAERRLFPNAFRFPTAEAALRYYASGPVNQVRERDPGGAHRARLLPRVREAVQAVVAREGVFREPKGAGLFVAGG